MGISKKLKSNFIWNLILFSILALFISNFLIIAVLKSKTEYILNVLLDNYFVSSSDINELINKLVTSPFVSQLKVLKNGVIYKELTGLSDTYNYILTKTFFGKTAIYKVKLFISLPDLVFYLYKKFLYISVLLTLLFDIFLLIFYRTILNNIIKPLEILFKNIKDRKIVQLISIKNKEFFDIQQELEDIFSTIKISQQKIKFITEILEAVKRAKNFKDDFEKLIERLIKKFPYIDGIMIVKKEKDGLLVKVYDINQKKEFKIDKESLSLYAFNSVNPKILGNIDKLNLLSEEEKELQIKDAFIIPIYLFSEKVGAFVVYSKNKLSLSEIEKEFFKLFAFSIFSALILDEVYKTAKNIEKVKSQYLSEGISNYLQILENRYIYGYKTQRILKILEQIKEVINKLDLNFEKLKEATIYMNIGLFMMPDKVVLNFEEDLSEEEKSLYEVHPILASIYLNLINHPDMEIKQAVLDHHENVDGTGFPSKKKDKEISPYAKVLRILDDFDSISYKESKDAAIKFLSENKGKYYDENILNEILPALEKVDIKEEIVIPDEILSLYKKVLEKEEFIKLPKFLEKIELEKNEKEKNLNQKNEKQNNIKNENN